ncbi:hypothetical protein EYZ11_003578 [Aspergillus tanneri]|uniref:Uncharacterized protein n=1 Tax=Aspergillus tanneri TaxID=1220188 RepID=A0A4S3JPZ5_9EURO|nr:hypothetical protein EYZ11_003578 [Aspergillus tanneri]
MVPGWLKIYTNLPSKFIALTDRLTKNATPLTAPKMTHYSLMFSARVFTAASSQSPASKENNNQPYSLQNGVELPLRHL